MGSCVSVHKDPASGVKLRFSIDPKNHQVSIPSPVKENADSVNAGHRTVGDVLLYSQLSPARFVDPGSKDDSFFDSQPWLESDCEDDFVSVNGDFTPSRGNTPVHHNFSSGNPRLSNARSVEVTVGSLLDQSPDNKKRLSELFKHHSIRNAESTNEKDAANNPNEVPVKVVPEATSVARGPKLASGAPYLSGANSMASSERTTSGEVREEEKWLKSGQCCLPRLISSRSFNERKKRTSPPPKDE